MLLYCIQFKRSIILAFIIAFVFTSGIAQNAETIKQTQQLLAKSDLLFARGVELYLAGNFRDAIPLFMESDKIDKAMYDQEHPRRDYSEMWLASCYYQMGDTAKAQRTNCYYWLVPVDRRLTVEADNLALLAAEYYYKGEYKKALENGLRCVAIEKDLTGGNPYRYANALVFSAGCCLFLGYYAEGLPLVKGALTIIEMTLGKQHIDYAKSLATMAMFDAYEGHYAKAIELETEALRIMKRTMSKEHPDYTALLINLSNHYLALGYYKEAMGYLKETLDIIENSLGKSHLLYSRSLNGLAVCNANLGNYEKAIEFGIEVLNIRRKTLGKYHPDYANSLRNLATYYADLGNYQKAIEILTEALNVEKRTLGKEHQAYGFSLSSLAQNYADLGNYQKAIELSTEALKICEKAIGKDHPNYATLLSYQSRYYFLTKNFKEAIELQVEALNIIESKLGVGHPNFASSLSQLAFYYYCLKNYEYAISFGTLALNIFRELLGKGHPNYATSLESLALYHYEVGDVHSLTTYSMEATHLNTNFIQKTFAGLTTYERNLFWKKFESCFLAYIPKFAYKYPTDSLIVNAYNGALLSKGLLLNSEMEMNKLLLESGDKEVLEAYTELQLNRQMLNRLYEKPITERRINTDSLERAINRKERELVKRSKTYGNYTRNLAITWEDVQQQLGKKDVAVEFVSFPHNLDSTMYVAYVLDAGMSVPQMVPLFEAKQLSAIPHSQYYTTPDISKLVWEKLDQYLTKADNIFFAPAGELYNIAIESLPDYDGSGLISDRHNFYRLSSTRELAVTKERNKVRTAVLYGGLRYDTDTKQMETDSRNYQSTKKQDTYTYHVADSLNLRGNIKYLPATKEETENINQSLKRAAIRSQLFTEDGGTEASFKDLSGRKTNILHLATHGFYWSEREAQRKNHLNFLMPNGDKDSRYIEDKAMVRSGLLFSGANNALKGKRLPEYVEDGILTAKEISSMDLRGLDLVVLSACQTGLGEITGDGVFGLQRGFKKAGANTLMMSLWKVDDGATQLLMTRFYDNLLLNTNPQTGKAYTKFEALKEAQQYVRGYEESIDGNTTRKPYEDPECWAAFVLLDAMD